MADSGVQALLVEDDSDVGGLLRHHLTALGCTVVHAVTGEDALEHLSQRQFDLAVVDIMLPGIDGRTIIRALQDEPRHRDCRIVVASIVDEEDLGLPVHAVLAKPFNRSDVVRALRTAGIETTKGKP